MNTIHDRDAPVAEDYLSDAARYFSWSARSGLITNAELRKLDQTASPRRLLAEVRKLREQVYNLFADVIDGGRVSRASLAPIDKWIHRAWSDLEFAPKAEDCLSWKSSALDSYLPLKRVALSSLAFMQNLEPERLKRCAAKGECGWLFYDDSKSNRRRWCAMDTCGAIAKMRRYRQRLDT
ncbi:MAG: CGNR zinc finger domain-containing protein [Chthoniobacterales bacterium]|nr:CGNR zinc finger domain-containing protein [Chthoniobacterales bacterium]